jgi:uncharacterized protein
VCASENRTTISVRVHPNSPRNQIVGLINGTLKVKIAAQPAKGKANKELIEFLSEVLGTRKTAISILKGETSHNKIVAIDGLNVQDVVKLLLSRVEGK